MYNRKVCFVAKRSYSIVQIFLNHVATIGQASDKVRVGIQMTRKRIKWFGTSTIIGFFLLWSLLEGREMFYYHRSGNLKWQEAIFFE